MILDSSSIIAVINAEPGFRSLVTAMSEAPTVLMSAATMVEVNAVLYRRGRVDTVRRVQRLLAEFDVEVVPFDCDQARLASDAYRDYGRGSGHPANLNLGDCYSYALAAQRNEPLLYVGDDFMHTDLTSALPGRSAP